MKKPHQVKSAQLEVLWPEPEAFALTVERAVDGNRISKEAAQTFADQQAAHQQQSEFLLS